MAELNDLPYKPRCILVTGGAGFIASHVAIRLVKNYPQYKVNRHKQLFYPLGGSTQMAIEDLPDD